MWSRLVDSLGSAAGLDAAHIAEADRLSLFDWTTQHRAWLSPDRLLNFDRHPYLVDIYRCAARKVVIPKASQVGVSEYLISWGMHGADQRDATVLYVFPTDTHVSDFSTGRIGPAIEASPYLSSIVVDAGGDYRRGADRVKLKRLRNRFLYLRGGKIAPDGRAPQLEAIDADLLILDEFDEMDSRAPVKARKRLDHSALAEERIASIPSYPNRGVHAEWLQSDRRRWHVRCDHCGKRQHLTIDHVVVEWDSLGRPLRWHGDEAEAWAACTKCGKRLNRLAPGEWVPTAQGDVAGFHVTKLFSSTVDLIDIVRGLQTVSETERKENITHDLAEPYTPRGGGLTDDVLDACRRDYLHGSTLAEETVLGCDVGSVLHVVVRGPRHPETGERPQRFADQVDTWDELARMMILYRVRIAVIDALPETTKAREFQAHHAPGRVWLAYYVAQKTGLKALDPWIWRPDEGVVDLDRTRTLDGTFADLYDGSITLPANARDAAEYYTHMKAPIRIVEDGVARYVESSPDHLAHAENYCRVAAHAGQGATLPLATQAAQARVVDATHLFN